MSQTWSDDERARIQAFAESGDPNDLTTAEKALQADHGQNGPVTIKKCRERRERVRDGDETGSDVTHSDSWSNTAMRDHIYGRCSHSESLVGEPAESPGPGGPRW